MDSGIGRYGVDKVAKFIFFPLSNLLAHTHRRSCRRKNRLAPIIHLVDIVIAIEICKPDNIFCRQIAFLRAPHIKTLEIIDQNTKAFCSVLGDQIVFACAFNLPVQVFKHSVKSRRVFHRGLIVFNEAAKRFARHICLRFRIEINIDRLLLCHHRILAINSV